MRFSIVRKALVVVLMVMTSVTFGQTYFGWRVGPNMGTFRGSSVHNAGYITGFNTGISFEFVMEDWLKSDFAKNLSFQVEGSITQKGTKSDYMRILPHYISALDSTYYGPDTTLYTGVVQKVTYLSIPLLLKYSIGNERSRFKPNFYGGAYINGMFSLFVDGDTKRSLSGNPRDDRRLYKDDYMGIEYGLIAGAGFIQKIGGRRTRWAVTGDFRYLYGLSNLGEYRGKPDIPEEQISDVKSVTFLAAFGVRYQMR